MHVSSGVHYFMAGTARNENSTILGLAFITFSLIFGMIGFNIGEEKGIEESVEIYAHDHNQYNINEIEEDCLKADAKRTTECIIFAVRSIFEDLEEANSLAVQQSISNWAKYQLWISFFSATVAGFGVWLLKRTLDATLAAVREGEKASQAALFAAKEARNANILMRDQRRPWVTMKISDLSALTFETQSNSLMLGLNVTVENVGGSPAKDLAIGGKIKIMPKREGAGLSREDWGGLVEEVSQAVAKDSIERRMTETLFVGRPQENFATRYVHAHLGDFQDEEAEVALYVCVSISYKTPSGQGGAIWEGLVTPLENGAIFNDFVGATKSAPFSVKVIPSPTSYY